MRAGVEWKTKKNALLLKQIRVQKNSIIKIALLSRFGLATGPARQPLSLGPSLDPRRDAILIDERLESAVRVALRHRICRVILTMDPPDLEQLPALVRLPKAHDVDHEALLFRRAKLDQALVERERVRTHDQRDAGDA